MLDGFPFTLRRTKIFTREKFQENIVDSFLVCQSIKKTTKSTNRMYETNIETETSF